MRNRFLVLQLLMIAISDYVRGALHHDDENTCLKSQKYKEVIYVDSTVRRPVTETSWCWDVLKGFKCRRQRVVNEKVKVPRVVDRTRFVLECCAGYVESDSKCVPYCFVGCGNGQCIKPNTCDCDSGYYGFYCDKSCPPEHWGRNCLEKCECLNDGECNGVNGRCLCKPGWLGYRCEIPCEMGSYGVNGTCRPLLPMFIPVDVKPQSSLLEQEDFMGKTTVRPVEVKINFPTLKRPGATAQTQQEEESTMLATSPKPSQEPNQLNVYPPTQTETVQPSTDTLLVPTVNITSTSTPVDHSIEYAEGDSESWGVETENSTEESTKDPHEIEENSESTESWLEDKTFTAETTIIDNNKRTLSTIRYGSPEVETIDEGSRDATEHPTTFPPLPSTVTTATTTTNATARATAATTATEITFTGETTSSKNSNFTPTKIDGYNFIENGTNNNDKNDAGDDDGDNDNYDYGKNESNEVRTSEITTQISGAGTRGDAPEVSEEGIEIFRHLHSFRFIPSLSVLTGVTILIIIIGARWLALHHRRKNKKLLAKKKDELFRSKERQKYRDSLLIGKGFPESSVYLYEINLTEERPILQTFKPPPDT